MYAHETFKDTHETNPGYKVLPTVIEINFGYPPAVYPLYEVWIYFQNNS